MGRLFSSRPSRRRSLVKSSGASCDELIEVFCERGELIFSFNRDTRREVALARRELMHLHFEFFQRLEDGAEDKDNHGDGEYGGRDEHDEHRKSDLVEQTHRLVPYLL